MNAVGTEAAVGLMEALVKETVNSTEQSTIDEKYRQPKVRGTVVSLV
ncbi:MAG: hypothetical protein LBG05_01805 [Treponema sp.]|jgi:hypothetical protein|nr:hypothetical protein [Treponema sp.]